MNDLDNRYSNREIKAFFNEIKDTLERIETQTTKTNGRVNKLENWRSYLLGGIAIISSIVVVIVIPLLDVLIRTGKL